MYYKNNYPREIQRLLPPRTRANLNPAFWNKPKPVIPNIKAPLGKISASSGTSSGTSAIPEDFLLPPPIPPPSPGPPGPPGPPPIPQESAYITNKIAREKRAALNRLWAAAMGGRGKKTMRRKTMRRKTRKN